MHILSFLIIGSLSMLFNTTRLFGICSLAFLSYIHPWLLLMYISVIGLYLFYKHKKSS